MADKRKRKGRPAIKSTNGRAAVVAERWQKGTRLFREGNVLRAIEELERAVALAPRQADLASGLGLVYRSIGSFGKALECYRKALAADPGHLDAGNDLAALYFARGLYDEARAILQRLAAAHPQDERTRDNLALLDKASAESGPAARLPLKAKGDRQTVSLCMIVRDEEANLPGCLESVRDLADEMIVVDTGSTDRTVQVAKSFGAKVYYFPWCNDFAAARNESLLRATGDWILYLDADERLEDGGCQKIRELVDAGKYDAYSLEIRNVKSEGRGEADTTHTYSRLFRNRPNVRFEGTVHEQIYPALYRAAMEVGPADVRIIHLGYDLSEGEIKRKAERNLPMLLLQRHGFPNDLLVRVNLANAYLILGRYADALSEFRAAVAIPSPEYHARAYAYLMVATLLLNHEKD
nr:glycosyltransferase [Dehalococcoidales bacterium]